MKPETGYFLAKARKLVAEADGMLAMHYTDAAGRTAYLAGFHAAQAFIFERTGKAAKTHSGVHTEFLRLTKDNAALDPDLRIFLSQSYNLKAIADMKPALAPKYRRKGRHKLSPWPNALLRG